MMTKEQRIEKLLYQFNKIISQYGEFGNLRFSGYGVEGVDLCGKRIVCIGFRGGWNGIAFYTDESNYTKFGDYDCDDLESFYVRIIDRLSKGARKFRVVVTADEGFVVDSLRNVALWLEESEEEFRHCGYDDGFCTATIEEVTSEEG